MSNHSRRRSRRHDARHHDDALADLYFGTPSHASSPHDDRRAKQLCRQVREQLELTLGELDDPVLDGIAVHDVALDLGGHTIRVDILVPHGLALDRVSLHLERVRGHLRSEIAAAIHRKRTPQLGFVLLPAGAFTQEQDHDE